MSSVCSFVDAERHFRIFDQFEGLWIEIIKSQGSLSRGCYGSRCSGYWEGASL